MFRDCHVPVVLLSDLLSVVSVMLIATASDTRLLSADCGLLRNLGKGSYVGEGAAAVDWHVACFSWQCSAFVNVIATVVAAAGAKSLA